MENFDEYGEPYEYGSGSNASVQYLEGLRNVKPDGRARIFLMGTKKCGKSSIEKVVFHKMSPHETLFLESTTDVRVKELSNNPLVQLQILDFPGNFDFEEEEDLNLDQIFKGCGALVFVIDAQEEPHTESVEYIVKTAELAQRYNPNLLFEIVIHKVDGDSSFSDERKASEFLQKTIDESLNDHLKIAKINIATTFYMTSIYDHSVFEAFSKIVQKLIPQMPFLENLLDALSTRCDIQKIFLFDVLSKIYVATDSNPFDMQTYELCSDVVDAVIDVSCIYGVRNMEDSLAFDEMSCSVIRLNNGYVLYLRQVSKYLALVCLISEKSFEKEGLVEFNLQRFKEALHELFEVRRKNLLAKNSH